MRTNNIIINKTWVWGGRWQADFKQAMDVAASKPVNQCTSEPVHQWTSAPVHQCTSVPVHRIALPALLAFVKVAPNMVIWDVVCIPATPWIQHKKTLEFEIGGPGGYWVYIFSAIQNIGRITKSRNVEATPWIQHTKNLNRFVYYNLTIMIFAVGITN